MKIKTISLSLFVVAISCFAIFAAFTKTASTQNLMDFEGGRICVENTVDVALKPSSDGLCPPDTTLNDKGDCIAKQSTISKFSFILNNDNSMDFGINYWSLNGQNCSLLGNAREDDGGWLYEDNMDSDNAFERCKFTITMTGKHVRLKADPEAACRSHCGIGAKIDDMHLPMSALKQMSLTPAMLQQDIQEDLLCGQ